MDDTIESVSTEQPAPVPWYTLNPKHLKFGRITRTIIIIAGFVVLFNVISVKPLWQFGWRVPLYCWQQLLPVTSPSGQQLPGGGWTRGRRILVYGAPGVQPQKVTQAAKGLRGLVDELGLNLKVEEVEAPADALRDIAEAQRASANAGFDFDRYRGLRLDARGEKYAEMVVVKASFTDPTWAWGLSEYTSGLAVLQENMTTPELGKHEGAHLLGYHRHDDLPWEVFGYQEEWYPQGRNTLMMLMMTSDDTLSDRARDALLNFWRGKEGREGERYFK
jgi:hypothetical protein